VVEGVGHVGVVRIQGLFSDRQRAFEEPSASLYLPCLQYTRARRLRVSATTGWPVPSAFSRTTSARLPSASASLYLPWSRYRLARLFRLCPTSGWFAPSAFSRDLPPLRTCPALDTRALGC